VARSIVVAFHMSPSGIVPGREGTYLSRARSLCVRGEALGGRLVAWGPALLAMGWDVDSIEEAVLFAASIREESLSVERAWAIGMAEGELESLSPTGQGILAWGPGLMAAASLAQLAAAGEVLVDDEVRSSSGGQLSLVGASVGARDSVEGDRSLRGWRLDLEHPWKVAAVQTPAPAVVGRSRPDAGLNRPDPAPPDPALPRAPATGLLAARIRKLALGAEGTAVLEALADLRRARARAEGATARCHASLALAVMLSIAGRADEALLESLDALARAQETRDPRAVGACMALLAKLYAGAGLTDAAAALRDTL
jgi:hypothetical protein